MGTSSTPRLSIVIPARVEQFLLPTIQDILKNRRLNTEIIVILDGSWPLEPIPDHPDVHLVYHPVSIGQRAATNEGVRLSRAEFICKCDGHVAFDEGFDAKLLAPYDSGELDRTVTSIPAQHRLHVYSRVCAACGHDAGQGPMEVACEKCQTKASYKMEMVWKPRNTPSTSWVLNADLHFCYDKKDRCRLNKGIRDVMTSLGACVLMKRDRWHEIGGLDESIGSWGAFGQELACKSWLSGGRHVCNTGTWFGHYFRVGGIGFPYPISGKDQERARKYSSNIWFRNAWPGQKLPLSWLVEKFSPIRGSEKPHWDEQSLARIGKAGKAFALSRPPSTRSFSGANVAPPVDHHPMLAPIRSRRERMPIDTVGAPAENSRPTIPTQDVLSGRNKFEVSRVGTQGITTDEVVELENVASSPDRDGRDEPSEKKPVYEINLVMVADQSVPTSVCGSGPNPTSGVGVDRDLGKYAGERLSVEVGNREILRVSHVPSSSDEAWSGAAGVQPSTAPPILPSLGILYYTHHKLDARIFDACLRQLQRAANGHRVVSVSWEPINFGENIVYKPGPSPHTNYFSQIALGLEALDTDYVALCEHDVLYDPSHLTFRPPTDDAYWYNENCWRVDANTGRAVTHQMRSVSGLVAHRALLVEHYRKMLALVKAKGYWYRIGHEPGVFPGRAPGVDAFPAMGWRSAKPYVDIRHPDTLTRSWWSPEKFQRPPANWQESDGVPGWGKTLGRFDAWLEEVTR